MGNSIFLLIALVSLSSGRALARTGGAGPGGGDECEQRFKEVALDVRKWVDGGGPKYLDFAPGDSAASYTGKMKGAMASFKVHCVTKDDPPDSNGRPVWPVQVNGKPKTCINWVEDGVRHFRCDEKKFYSSRTAPTNDSGQYRLVHHEFAAIAGLEPHNEDDSSYAYSNQLEGFLENKKVLAIRPKKEPGTDLKLSRLERSQKTARRAYPTPRCLETIKTVRGFDREGRLRVEISEKSCPGEPAVSYHVKVLSSDGDILPDEGIALNIHEGLRHANLAGRMPEKGLRLQRIFLRLNSGIPCQIVKVSPEGQLLDTADCKFSTNQEAPKNEAPLDEGVAPAA